ncbi:hypothetical protein JFT60_25430 [Pseudomonas sp. MF6772]|uniref:hypothetical protein n=1 Tax=Pseudomonas sp. MF6772 TaxID=2797533 RepID=UPI0018E8D21B|nr:hypothetical protein [Pseudomonas sp. MF6772]MBJ2270724.1 hypothetical protein [Pseudomonas sp. MF6772]
MIILFNDAIRFLTEKTDNARCPCCGAEKWIVPFADKESTTVFLMPLQAKFGNEPAYNLALECSNCGFVREHRAKFIADWVAQNPSKEKNE